MSRGDSITIPTPSGTGAGNAVKVADYGELALQIHLTGAADVTIQMSLQKTPAQFVDLPAPFANLVAGDAVHELPEHAIIFLRAFVNVAVPPGDTLTLAGYSLRS